MTGVIVTKQGSAFTFGRNTNGQLGLGDDKTRTFPRKVDSLTGVVDAACGRHHTIFLTDQGRVYSTGKNDAGQLGLGDKKLEQINTPKRVPFEFGGKVIKVACGADFSMALNDQGQVYAWGHPNHGCLGNGTDGAYFITASKLTYHFEFAPILVTGWCEKVEGMMGEGREKAEMQPVVQPKILDIACGPEHSVAMAEDGNVFTWGFGGYGRLGHSSPDNEMRPRLVEHFKPTNPHTKGVSEICVGGSCAIVMTKALGHPYFWGQLKSSGEATMYPKIYHEGMSEEKLQHMGLGHKHVVLATSNNTYALGSSPCYGELGYGDGEKRSSTVFRPMGSIGPVPILGVACGFAQSVMIADTSTAEARKALYQLPTLGTLSEVHTIIELAEEAADVLADENYVVMLDNVQQIVEMIVGTDDAGTLKKLRGNVDKINGTIKEMFGKLKESFASGDFVPTGPSPDEGQLEAATLYVKDLIEKHGTDSDEIAASITGAISEKIM